MTSRLQPPAPELPTVEDAIMERWSVAGLKNVKAVAWQWVR